MKKESFKRLREFLKSLSVGKVQPDAQKELLEKCWDNFEGSDSEGMAAYKLQRAEDLEWEPPFPHLHDREAWRHGVGRHKG